MASTFSGLYIGTSGLYTYQAALNTTAHNTANVENTGYTRQQINQTASTPISCKGTYGMVGTGVTANKITQTRSEYYDTKYRTNHAISGFYSTKEEYMLEVENYFNELDHEGFVSALTQFSNSFQELSKDTTNGAVRVQIAQFGSSVSEYINSLANNVKSLQQDANFEIKNSVDRISGLAEQIAAITKQINSVEVNGITANDLRDSRNELVDELSQYANITVSEHVVGDDVGRTTYIIKLDGKTLVDTNEYNKLKVVPRDYKMNVSDADGLYNVEWSNGEDFDPTSQTLGGKLQALFELRDGNNGEFLSGKVSEVDSTNKTVTIQANNLEDIRKLTIAQDSKIKIGNKEYDYSNFTMNKNGDKYELVFQLKSTPSDEMVGSNVRVGETYSYKGAPYYMNRLNEFARTFAKEFNAICSDGVYKDKDGNEIRGGDFFTASSYSGEFNEDDTTFDFASSYYYLTADQFCVSKTILDDPSKIVTSSALADGVQSTNILDRLVKCLDDKSMFKEGSPSQFLQSFISDIAVDTKKATTFKENQEDILASITNQRLSISGVDIEEEGMNLIKFQNAYNLSAKVISVMDEIYNKLINEMGV